VALALALFLAGGTVARADGRIDAVSYKTLPDDIALSVGSYGDSDADESARRMLDAALRDAGRHLDKGAPYSLMLDRRIDPGSHRARRDDLGRLRGYSGGARLDVNIWSTNHDSLIGGRYDGDADMRNPTLRFDLILRRVEDGRVLWEGRAEAPMNGVPEGAVTRDLMHALAGSLGETVRDRRISLP
jgi:hypothetical protein